MPVRDFITLEPRMAPSVPGCPRPTIIQHVRDAAIEVCKKTLAWRFEQDFVRLTPGVYSYDFDTPDYTEATGIISATVNGVPLVHMTQEELHSSAPMWPSADSSTWGSPATISQIGIGTFVLEPVPDASLAYDVKMFLALKPTRDAVGMDNAVFDALEQLILHGALQHLLVLPNKPWSDRELATYHAKQYTFKTSSFRADANLGASRSSLSVKMRPLA